MRRSGKRARRLPGRAYLPPFVSAFIVILCAFVFPGAPRWTSLWKGSFVLILREGSDAERRFEEAAGSAAFPSGAIARTTAPVQYNGFSGLESAVVASIALDDADPRFDPFLKGLNGYFASADGSWRIAYIPAACSAAGLYARLAASLGMPGGGSWRLADFDPVCALLSMALAAAAAYLLARTPGRKHSLQKAAAAVFAAAWLPPLLGGGPGVAWVFFVFSAAWVPLSTECAGYAEALGRKSGGKKNPPVRGLAESLFRFILTAVLASAAYCAVLGSSAAALFSFGMETMIALLAASATFALAGSAGGRTGVAQPGRRALAKEKTPFWRTQTAVFFMAAFLFSSASAAVQTFRYSGLSSPYPVQGAGGIGWEWIEKETGTVGKDSLPDFAQAAAHQAYLAGFDYGRPYAVPKRGERVVMREYKQDPASLRIRESLTTIAEFDSAWLAGIMERARTGSVERMLLDQGKPVQVAAAGSGRIFARGLYFSLLCFLFSAAALPAAPRLGLLISGDYLSFNFNPRKRTQSR